MNNTLTLNIRNIPKNAVFQNKLKIHFIEDTSAIQYGELKIYFVEEKIKQIDKRNDPNVITI